MSRWGILNHYQSTSAPFGLWWREIILPGCIPWFYKIILSRCAFGCPPMKYFQMIRSDPPKHLSETVFAALQGWSVLRTCSLFSPPAHPGLCLTEPCITVAGMVIGGLDQSVDPCNDFYKFACGGWMKNNPLPEGKSRWGTFSNLWEHNMLVMKHLLGKAPLPTCLYAKLRHNVSFFRTDMQFICLKSSENTTIKGLSGAEEKAQRYYQACMNEAKIEELGAKPLQELISKVCFWI